MQFADKTLAGAQADRSVDLQGAAARRPVAGVVDDRPEAITQRLRVEAIQRSALHAAQRAVHAELQRRPRVLAQRQQLDRLFGDTLQPPVAGRAASAPAPNRTGLPDDLRSGIERLSGISLQGVRVHFNSAQPAQVGALAYARGRDIHLAPGQERHLPHEAWHVVQQARAPLQPTLRTPAGIPINEDPALEHEAETMGRRALAIASSAGRAPASDHAAPAARAIDGPAPAATGVLQRFTDQDVRERAERLAREQKGGDDFARYVEAKIQARAHELSSGDMQRDYFTAQRETERAWTHFESIQAGRLLAAADEWAEMKAGLSSEEWGRAMAALKPLLVAQFRPSRDLAGTRQALAQPMQGVADAVRVLDAALNDVQLYKQTHEVLPTVDLTATSGLLEPLKGIHSVVGLKEYARKVARLHGVSPLDAIEDFVNNLANNLPIQGISTAPERSLAIAEAEQEYQPLTQPGLMGQAILPQPIDPQHRTGAKKANVGPEARHVEEILTGPNRRRQLVLGVGRPGDPQGYQDFAKDYGLWDYESWAAWNKHSDQFPVGKTIDPDNGADVDKVLDAKDRTGRDVFEKLHFRLQGVFPGIASIHDKLVAAIALYNENAAVRNAEYYGKKINALWTLGEICTIAFKDELRNKTIFYGEQRGESEDATAVLHDLPHIVNTEIRPKIAEYTRIGDEVYDHFRRQGLPPLRLGVVAKFVADKYFLIPYGRDHVIRKVEEHLASNP